MREERRYGCSGGLSRDKERGEEGARGKRSAYLEQHGGDGDCKTFWSEKHLFGEKRAPGKCHVPFHDYSTFLFSLFDELLPSGAITSSNTLCGAWRSVA